MLLTSIAASGYEFVAGAEMRSSLGAAGSLADWREFAASWADLCLDPYLAEGARFRKRRFAVFAADARGQVERLPHQPHFQRREYNALFGGIERWFEPVADAIGGGPSLRTIITFCVRFFGPLAPDVARWHIEVHQFRIEARQDLPGQPTPEGVHRDGVDFVLVLLVNRLNIASGTTTVHDMDGKLLGSFTLTDPLDSALVHDTRVKHGVTEVRPIDPAKVAYRDVLVVTLRDRATVVRR